jgi:hypothetical protein
MDIVEFYDEVRSAHAALNGEWRFGQTMFNGLVAHRPDLAERVRGTSIDPFYADPDDTRFWDEFTTWLAVNW